MAVERRPLVSGNWKMHHDHIEAVHAVRDLALRLEREDVARVDVSIHPPFTDLRTVQTLLEADGVPVALGAQHCNMHERGAYTGEVSPQMLARMGVRYVIVGHSERRTLYAMSDEDVAATLRAVLGNQMTPICCVGETEAERSEGRMAERVRAQLQSALGGLPPAQLAGMVVAYEPVWAIGSGSPASPRDAEEACGTIRETVKTMAGAQVAESVRIQYGGSVAAENAAEFTAEPDVDGLLVGGASLEAATFLAIVRAVRTTVRGKPGAAARTPARTPG